jgi:hypothetical protein
MSVNSISGSLPAEVGNIQNIEVINMAWNQLEGGLPTTMGALNSNGYAAMNELSFEWNRMEGTLPSELGLLTKLRMFNFGFNSISGSIPAQLTNLTDLQVLYLSGNQLTGELPEELGKLQRMRFFNASSNNISGTLPPSVGALSDLNDLSLFENHISGSLPLELGSVFPLRHLRMNDNRLDANFTKFHTLGNLRNLVTLDLYNNRMSGEVPPSLQNLTSLQYLYLDNEHYKPLRQKYCRQRLPNNGKYNYRIVRDEYVQMTSVRALPARERSACPRTQPITRSPQPMLTERGLQRLVGRPAARMVLLLGINHPSLSTTRISACPLHEINSTCSSTTTTPLAPLASQVHCEDMHDTNFAFNSLQVSGVYPD